MLEAVLLVTGMGLGAGVILVAAAKFLYVAVDETQTKVRAALPGVNCGACGFAGCDAYAAYFAGEKDAKTNLCTPGGANVAQQLSEILGVQNQAVIPKKAVICCVGTAEKTTKKMQYQGPTSCKACSTFFKGDKSCAYGCLGYGDCSFACAFGAINIKDGVAVIDLELCTGCGACADACPMNLIDITTAKSKV